MFVTNASLNSKIYIEVKRENRDTLEKGLYRDKLGRIIDRGNWESRPAEVYLTRG